VAGPGLGEGQVAVLRLHLALRWPRNEGSILLCEGNVCAPEHKGSARTSENTQNANFALKEFYEVRTPTCNITQPRPDGLGTHPSDALG
jgi:hypothetical protein